MSDLKRRLERVEQSAQAKQGAAFIVQSGACVTLNCEPRETLDAALTEARAKFETVILINVGATTWTPD